MLNLDHLKYFQDASVSRSLAEAARKNRVTRSAVSQAIRALESELDVELLHHRKNSFQLTSEGTLLAERCHDVFSMVGRLHDEVQGAKKSVSGTLSIAASHSISTSVLPGALKRFHREHPRVAVALSAGNSFRVRDLLRSRQVDLGFGLNDPNFAEFARIPIRKGRFVLASARAGEKLTPATRFLVGDRGEEVASLRRSFEKRHRAPLSALMEVQSWEVIAALVRKGLGVGLVPEFLLAGDIGRDLREVRTDFALHPYELCAFCRDPDLLPRSARALLERLSGAGP